MQKITVKNCDYDCDLGKKGRGKFRVYCKREKGCSQNGAKLPKVKPLPETLTKYKGEILPIGAGAQLGLSKADYNKAITVLDKAFKQIDDDTLLVGDVKWRKMKEVLLNAFFVQSSEMDAITRGIKDFAAGKPPSDPGLGGSVASGIYRGHEIASMVAKPTAPLLNNADIVIDTLGKEPMQIDDIIRATGLSPSKVASALVMLELKGIVQQTPGKNFAILATKTDLGRVLSPFTPYGQTKELAIFPASGGKFNVQPKKAKRMPSGTGVTRRGDNYILTKRALENYAPKIGIRVLFDNPFYGTNLKNGKRYAEPNWR